MLSARSEVRFPTLAEGPVCPWHDDCTPMDCENYRTTRNVPPLFVKGKHMDSGVQSLNKVPIKPSKRGKK